MFFKTFGCLLQGTYLLLEKLRYAVYRRLLRKVHAVHAELEPEKRTQIPLPQFQHALAMQVRCLAAATCPEGWASVLACSVGGRPMRSPAAAAQGVLLDMDEVECIAANLIYRKYCRGYISHKNKVMVVAKADPFPPLNTVSLAD